MNLPQRAGATGIRALPTGKPRSSRTVNLAAYLLLMLASLLAGCTTLQPMADNAESLRNDLRGGEGVKPGDKVRVVTRDGLSRLLIVTALDQNSLTGHPEGAGMEAAVIALPIDDIVFMEGERVSVGKTAAYTGGATLGTVITLIIAFIIAFATSA